MAPLNAAGIGHKPEPHTVFAKPGAHPGISVNDTRVHGCPGIGRISIHTTN